MTRPTKPNGAATVVAFDTETYPIQPGLLVPRLVCLTWAQGNDAGIKLRAGACKTFLRWLRDDSVYLVGHNVAFDLAVMMRACAEEGAATAHEIASLVFAKVGAGLVSDTKLREQLIALATEGMIRRQKFNLAVISMAHGGADRSALKHGPDVWRLRYNELDGVPLEQWPAPALDYAIDDARDTLMVWNAQASPQGVDLGGQVIPLVLSDGRVHDEARHVKAALALHLAACWGLRVDETELDAAYERFRAQHAEAEAEVKAAGLIRANGSSDLKAIRSAVAQACHAAGIPVPTTDKGSVKTSSDVLESVADHNPVLAHYTTMKATEKVISTYLDAFAAGRGGVPVTASYDPLKKTGRTSSFKPNIQNLPRGGGLRRVFVPRDGRVFLFSDFDSLELRAFAQAVYVLLGGRTACKMFQAYNDDPDLDPHTMFAASMLRMAYADAMEAKKDKENPRHKDVKEHRQFAKIANFGFPGGMGSNTLVSYAKGYGVDLDEAFAKMLKDQWREVWPEAGEYLDYIGALLGRDDSATLVQVGSGRMRAGCNYCEAANGYFQALAADGAKEVLWRVSRECYAVPTSPLYGSRIVAFIHDELALETPEDRCQEAADRLQVLMVEGMATMIPDVPIRAGMAITRRWIKGAESARQDDGSWTIVEG